MRVHRAVAALTVTAAILFLNPWAVCFRAQSADPGEAFRRRLEALEQQVRTIQSVIDARAPKPDGNGAAPSLKDRLDEVWLQIKILARQVELDKEQAAERARQAPVSTAGREGFLLRSSDGVSPRTRFDPANGTWGAVEVTTRYSTLVIDGEAFPAFANPATSARAARAWAAGVNWYLNSAVKLSANYELTRVDGGAASGNRSAEHSILSRMQIAF